MKKLIILFIVLNASISFAQGGIGVMPREDIVKLRAVVRDSLSNEVMLRIADLQRFAAANQIDSAAAIIAHNGGAAKTGKWMRASDLQNPEEAARVNALIEKIKKLAAELPEMKGQYYAVFVDKDNPCGQKHLYQINCSSGAKKRMVSFTFYPIGEVMMLGDIN
jgi:hypothetical protein